jgi:protein ImuA
MPALKADIITQLKKELLALQGFRPLVHAQHKIDLGTINHSFPNSQFPLGVNHEFICNDNESLTASSGFIAGILSNLLQKSAYAKASADRGGAVVWISSTHIIFPPALASFGINPAQIIFIRLRNRNQILWTIEEALKCEGLTAVVGEPSFIDLAISRRLQLATEQSGVTGFLLRTKQQTLNTTACTCRWQIHPLQSETEDGLPGVGFPRLKVELLKVRNGRPGKWELEWNNARGRFNEVITKHSSAIDEHKEAV